MAETVTSIPEEVTSEVKTVEGETSKRRPKDDLKKITKVKSVVHIWDKDEIADLFCGIGLATLEGKDITENKEARSSPTKSNVTAESGDDAFPDIRQCDKMFCASCSLDFEEREDQTEHFKSDWHRFNLKRKLKGDNPVTESKFEEITKSGDLSSISGSDNSDSEEDVDIKSSPADEDEDEGGGHIEGIGKRHPRIFMRNAQGELMSVYRCVVHAKKTQPDSAEDLLSMVQRLPAQTKWCVLMFAGGHFAGAVFEGSRVVEHKTFHRYVVRAKRGTVQSSRDNKGHAPKSGGATLRRYNEAALTTEIQELLTSWSAHLSSCDRIFLRVPTYNKAVLFSGKSPLLDKKDARLRLVPFQTRRPTFKELQRVVDLLGTVECYGKDSTIEDHITVSPKKPTAASPTKDPVTREAKAGKGQAGVLDAGSSDDSSSDIDMLSAFVTETMTINTSDLKPFDMSKKPRRKKKPKKKPDENETPAKPKEQPEQALDPEMLSTRNELYTACKTKDSNRLAELLQDLKSKDFEDSTPSPTVLRICCAADLLNSTFGEAQTTLLHVAVLAGHKEAITLLMEAGADPTVKDKKGMVPYLATSSKEIRNVFRRFVAEHPDMYDYGTAQIPGPLSEDQEREKRAREAERKKAMKKAKKERQKDKKAEEAQQREEHRDQQRYLALSDRQKRAIAAEKRLASQATSQGQQAPVLSRCFQCGTDITGKVPFEYHEYTFCTPKCLREHRTQKAAAAKTS